MKGQINIDYAIAIGVFIAGVTTALTLTISTVQPADSGFTDSLLSQTSTVSERFSDEVSWSIDEKNIYYERHGFDNSTLSVIGVEPDRNYSVASDKLIASDFFEDRVVFTTQKNHIRILGSDSGIDSSGATETFSLGSSVFSNDKIDLSYSDSGVDYYDLENTRVIEEIEMENSGVQSSSEGSVSANIDYGTQKIYLYGGEMPEFYVRSVTQDTNITIPEELTTAEVLRTDNSYSLSGSNSFSGSGPVIIYNSSIGVGFAGPGTEFNLTSSNSGDTQLELKGSYNAFGFTNTTSGRERARARLEFSRIAGNELEGVNLSQTEELFNNSDILFSSKLGLTGGFNISFKDFEKGDNLPLDSTVVSQSPEKNVLLRNGSIQSEDLEVQLWQ